MFTTIFNALMWLFGFWKELPEDTKKSVKEAAWKLFEPIFAAIYDAMKKSQEPV